MKRVIVCGGRDYGIAPQERAVIFSVLDKIRKEHGDLFIVEGGAIGTDSVAREWAHKNKQPAAEVSAHWYTLGKNAGPIRNGWMLLLQPDFVVAFPGRHGTADMVKQARAAGVKVIGWAEVAEPEPVA